MRRAIKHGMSKSPEFRTWGDMRQRCFNTKNANYSRYGGRGITVCERWNEFSNFLADMGFRPPGMSIDRIDNEGNYEPSNCRWATPEQQYANTRRSLATNCKRGHSMADAYVDKNGKRKCRTCVSRGCKKWREENGSSWWNKSYRARRKAEGRPLVESERVMVNGIRVTIRKAK